MAFPEKAELIGLLGEVARKFGPEPLGAAATDQLLAFCELFLSWNAKINLGGRVGVRELIELHLVDSFAAAPFVSDEDRVMDVGTGGGLPALPLAVLRPGCTFVLFEPRAKRVAFLRTAIRQLGIGGRVAVEMARVEAGRQPFADRPTTRFSLAMSRATWAPVDWLRIGRELVPPPGRVMVFATRSAAATLGHAIVRVDYLLNRSLCVF